MENIELKKVLKYTGFLVIILAIFLVVQIIASLKSYKFIGSDFYPQNVVTVSGRGEAFAVPDILSFTFTISEEAKTVGEAQEKATTKTNSALEFLEKNEIEEKDIKTVGYNVNPKYEYDYNKTCPSWGCPPPNQTIYGYEVSQTVSVKIRDTEKGGQILSGLGQVGPSYVSGLNFEIDNLESVQAEARKLAIEDAKEKAEILSKDLGVKIVRIVNFSEQGDGYYPKYGLGGDVSVMREEVAIGAPAPQIPTGENEIVSIVNITYEIR